MKVTIYYGVQNNKYSKFFNRSSGGSITCRGRYLISLNGIVCEMFAGKYRFKNVGAIMHMISQIRKEVYSPFSLFILEQAQIDKEDVIEYLCGDTKNDNFRKIIRAIINDLDELTAKKVFFKNNINAVLNSKFFRETFMKRFVEGANENYTEMKGRLGDLDENKRVITLSRAIYSDAYAYPPNCKDIFDKLDIIIQELSFGFYWYDYDYVEEANRYTTSHLDTFDAMYRHVISVVDTDSNMLLVDDVVDIILPYMSETNIEPEKKNYYDEIVSISIATYVLAKYAHHCLTRYKFYAQIPEEKHYHINMKNEFYFSDLFVSSSRKNYIARIMVKEGMVYDKPEFEIKGLAIKKSGNNENMRDVAANLIEMIFNDKGDNKLLENVYNGMEDERLNIFDSLSDDRGLDYYTSLKLADELDNMEEGEHRVKAINMWNSLYPDNPIIPPANFYTIPLDIDEKKLKDNFPKEYRTLVVNMYKRSIQNNLVDPIKRLTITCPAVLEEKAYRTNKVFNDYIVAINDHYRLYMDEVDALEKSDIDNEFLSIKLFELRKKAIEQRKVLEKEIFAVYKTFRYPGSFYKMTAEDMKNNDYKLILKLNGMKEYKSLFTNKNDTVEKFFGKIAMPIDSVIVPEFVRMFVSTSTFITLFDSLLAPIMAETGMIFVRTTSDKRIGTNIKKYF